MEVLKRFGMTWESARRLAQKCAEAKRAIGIHGVSVTASEIQRSASFANRSEVETRFHVHNTPTRSDPLHRTVELPEPITDEVATAFNQLFGRVV